MGENDVLNNLFAILFHLLTPVFADLIITSSKATKDKNRHRMDSVSDKMKRVGRECESRAGGRLMS